MRGYCILGWALLFPTTFLAQQVETGVYVMSQGAVEVTREMYSFDGTTLTDTVHFPSRDIRMESVARYDADHLPVTYSLDLYRSSAVEPIQHVDVMFSDTAAVWSTNTEQGDSTGVTRLDGTCVFLQNLVFAHLAVVLLKYDHSKGGTQSLDVWIPEQAAVMQMEITFTTNTSGTVEIAGIAMDVEIDANGWLRRATVSAQDVTVESVDGSPGT